MIKMVNKIFFLTATVLLASTGFGQDPFKVAPEAYKLEFENEWVKVTRVHYAAHVKIPVHDHTETGAAYVYLNDSGPVLFRHIGASYGAVTRPETKAGSFRLYRAVKEVHEVENPGDTPSDFLRVEFKTDPDAGKPLRGKFFRESDTGDFQRVQFENEQVRIVRMLCSTGKACDVTAGATEPVLLVALTPAQLRSSGASRSESLEAGKTRWVQAGRKATIINLGGQSAEMLRFEFKSKPGKGNPNGKGPNAHPHE